MNVVVKTDNCVKCERSFTLVAYHSKNMCRNCYNIKWAKDRETMRREPKSRSCIECKREFGSNTHKDGKKLLVGSKGMCKPCYQQSYLKSVSTTCTRCGRDMGKKAKGFCSICKVELEEMKAPSRRNLPDVNKIKIDKETKESMRRVFNRYKFGLNTLVDPFIVTDLYLTVFSSESTKGMTASKTEFNLDQFDEESQVMAMLKLLKKAYDIA